MADDLSGPFLEQRQTARTEDNVRFLEGLGGGAESPAPETPPTSEKPEAESGGAARGRQPLFGGYPTSVVGGARDAIVQFGQTLNDVSEWLRSQGIFPEAQGPKLTIRLPEVKAQAGTGHELVRGVSQFLTGFVPLFKATKGLGLARGAVAGAGVDIGAFDPHDPRVSNLINELAPALKNPVTEYLAAQEGDTGAEGRFKNAIEGLGLGAATDGLLRVAKAIRAGRKLTVEEVKGLGKEALASEAGFVKPPGAPGAGAPAAAAPIKPTKLVEVVKATPEQLKEWMAQDPTALNLGDRVLKIGWEQFGSQEGLEEVIDRTTKVFRERVETARRGKISDVELRKLASTLDMTVEDYLSRTTGEAMNAEKSLALVNILGASAKRLQGLAGQVAAGNLDLRQPMLDQLSIHAAIQEQAFGIRAEAGRALRVWGMDADGTVKHATALAVQLERMKTGQLAAAGGLDAERMARMILEVDAPEKLARLAREATKPGKGDMFMEYWINALLSNPTTHAVNFVSNTLTAVWAIPERALAARLAADADVGVMKGEVTAMAFGLVNGFMDALRLGGHALRTGAPASATTKIEHMSRQAISGVNLGASGSLGAAVDVIGQAVRLPGRFLMASDEFFKAINGRMEAHAQAYRQAVGEGHDGKALAARVNGLLNDADFLAKVKPIADEFADYQTFTKPLGALGQAVLDARESHPLMKLVIPFVRTPVNIFKYAGARTPFLNRAFGEVRADLAAGGARAQLARARVQLGGMAMATGAVLASSGYITGKGPTDPNLRREWLEMHQPYSVKVGDKWIGYNRLDPLGIFFGMAADAASVMGELDDVTADQLAATMALSLGNNMLSKTYLSGLADVLEGLQDPTEKGTRAVARLVGSVVPSGVAQVERITDPTLREARGALDQVISRVPGWSKTLPPRLNLWGEPIILEGGWGPDIISPFYVKFLKDDPVSQEMVAQKISVAMPARHVWGARPPESDVLAQDLAKHGVPLTDDEYHRYVKLAAGHGLGNLPSLKEKIRALIASEKYGRLSDGPDGSKAVEIKGLIANYRAAAQDKLIADSPELQQAIKDKLRARGEALRPASRLLPAPASPRGTVRPMPGSLTR